MLQCPECERTFKEAAFAGWLVYGRGFCSINKRGEVDIVGPIVPMVSVEPGKKLLEADVKITCPHCAKELPAKDFTLITPCVLTGGNAKVPVVLFTGAEILVAENVAAWAAANLGVLPPHANDRGDALTNALRSVAAAYVRG